MSDETIQWLAGRGASFISGFAAAASITYFFLYRHTIKTKSGTHYHIAMAILASWTLLPPIYFWLCWEFITVPAEAEHIKHTHELARNIWIALIVVLAVTADLKFPGGKE